MRASTQSKIESAVRKIRRTKPGHARLIASFSRPNSAYGMMRMIREMRPDLEKSGFELGTRTEPTGSSKLFCWNRNSGGPTQIPPVPPVEPVAVPTNRIASIIEATDTAILVDDNCQPIQPIAGIMPARSMPFKTKRNPNADAVRGILPLVPLDGNDYFVRRFDNRDDAYNTRQTLVANAKIRRDFKLSAKTDKDSGQCLLWAKRIR